MCRCVYLWCRSGWWRNTRRPAWCQTVWLSPWIPDRRYHTGQVHSRDTHQYTQLLNCQYWQSHRQLNTHWDHHWCLYYNLSVCLCLCYNLSVCLCAIWPVCTTTCLCLCYNLSVSVLHSVSVQYNLSVLRVCLDYNLSVLQPVCLDYNLLYYNLSPSLVRLSVCSTCLCPFCPETASTTFSGGSALTCRFVFLLLIPLINRWQEVIHEWNDTYSCSCCGICSLFQFQADLLFLFVGEREESESEAVPGGTQLSFHGNVPFKDTSCQSAAWAELCNLCACGHILVYINKVWRLESWSGSQTAETCCVRSESPVKRA